jgi:hypothetical protein
MELEERIERLERLLAANGITTQDGTSLNGEEALAYLDGQGMSIYGGLAYTQENLGKVAGALVTTANAVQTTAEATGNPVKESLDFSSIIANVVSTPSA